MSVPGIRGGSARIWMVQVLVAVSSLLGNRPAAAQTFSTLHEFSSAGGHPQAGLMEASDGNLWGATYDGGAYGMGSLYVLTPNGLGGFTFTEPYSFTGGADGTNPLATVVEGLDGKMYGLVQGGTSALGLIYRIDPDGNNFEVMHALTQAEGWGPVAALIQGSDGLLYGTAPNGGAVDAGTIFSFDPSSGTLTVIHDFRISSGVHPRSALLEGADGRLYGTTEAGGAGFTRFGQHVTYEGVVYRLDKSGANFVVLHSFKGTDGTAPEAALIQLSDGFLYGTTMTAGDFHGTVFKLDTAGHNFQVLHHLTDTGGTYPFGALVEGPDGLLYGTASNFSLDNDGTVFRLSSTGTNFEVVHGFLNPEGVAPLAGLRKSSDGSLYGTTQYRGAGNYGAAFQVKTTGDFTVVHPFVARDGFRSIAGLTPGPGGFFYGTASNGGSQGYGAVFKVNGAGTTYSVLHSFGLADGAFPYGSLIIGADGFLYGTTHGGFGFALEGYGSVFRLDTNGSNFSVLHTFTVTDGNGPIGGVIQGADGFLYGTTVNGGTFGQGVVYRLSTSGQNFSLLHEFATESPEAPLLQAADGLLYGTTYYGGTQNFGSVFRLDTSGNNFEVIHSFSDDDGYGPSAGLIQLADGKLYGTTFGGNPAGMGVVFKLDPSGSNFAVIHAFSGADGKFSFAPLFAASDGFLYGTTDLGGDGDMGTVFRLTSAGASFSSVHSFDGSDGASLFGGVVQGSDGALYGVARDGGSLNGGVVFRLDTAGAAMRRR